MSIHIKCICGRKKNDHSDLTVINYKCNYSAFNGYKYTPSDYSLVKCNRTGCNGMWRTKARYVDTLPSLEK